MKKLHQYIHDNKHLFEEEPENGHFERLQQKINRKHHKTVFIFRSIAVSIALLFSVTTFWYFYDSDPMMLTYKDTGTIKHCYLNQMNDIVNQINELTKGFDSWDKQQIMNDVKNIIEMTKEGFEKELPEELPEETTRLVLSNYYKQHLESLQVIVKTLRKQA